MNHLSGHDRAGRLAATVYLVLLAAGCAEDVLPAGNAEMGGQPSVDLVLPGGSEDASVLPEPDAAMPVNECGDHEPTCSSQTFAPPFPLRTDPMPEGGEDDLGVKRNANGYVVLDPAARVATDYLWLGNSDLGAIGTVSKYSTKNVREVARYRSVTCFSLKTGSNQPCDGQNGCCSVDDWPRYQARVNKMQEPPHQSVQLTQNSPSRTAIDLNGDLYVANQAFGGQSSVTHIAADLADCVDRNHNGRVDTSSDSNGDGFIQVDCNGDGAADTFDAVKQKPCSNGLPQEFYGTDDECVLWTSNIFTANRWGRAIAGVPRVGGRIDVWAGVYNQAAFVKLDGATGIAGADARLDPACLPFSALADGRGIVWAGPLGGGKLCWFDSAKPADNGAVRDPPWGQANGFGLTIDRDQNIWTGLTVARYTPDRSKGSANLSNGWWARMGSLMGAGIAADSRTANDHYVYSCGNNGVIQIPASSLSMMHSDQTIANPGWPTVSMPCSGVGIDSDQNLWGANSAVVARARVDKAGKMTMPANEPPMGMNICPAGDTCKSVGGNEVLAEFTGFNPVGAAGSTSGRYSRTVVRSESCGVGRQTKWLRLAWEADVPANTKLDVRYRSGDSPTPDIAWTAWTPAIANPEMLTADHAYLQVEFGLSTSMPGASPALKSFTLLSECTGP